VSMKPKLLLCAALMSSASLFASPALAEYELYNRDGTKLLFNADLAVAGFLNDNSWFGQSKSFLGANTDHWWEFGFEPQLSLETPLAKGTFFGKLSGVYTGTFGNDASGLTIGLNDPNKLTLEQGYVGWKRSGLFPALKDDTFSISLGRQDYSIGTGLLIADGGGTSGCARHSRIPPSSVSRARNCWRKLSISRTSHARAGSRGVSPGETSNITLATG
jgi:hypothetical protein